MSVAETEIKWNHVNGEDWMDVTSANPLVSPCVNALLELNNVENAVVLALGTLRSGGEASVWIGSSVRLPGRRSQGSRASSAVAV